MKSAFRFLQYLWRISNFSKVKILYEIFLCIYQGIADFLVGVYLYNFLASLIVNDGSYKDYVAVAATILGICLFRGVLQIGYSAYLKPIFSLKIEQELSAVAHKKQSHVILSAYENPEFYNLMNRACSSVGQLPDKVMSTLTGSLSFIVTSLLTMSFAVSIDPLFIAFLTLPLLHGVAGRWAGALQYELSRQLTQAERKQQNVKDTAFSAEASKDLRTTRLYTAFEKAIEESEAEMEVIIKAVGAKLAVTSFLSALAGTHLPLLCSCSYTAYKFFITKQLDLADTAGLIAAITLFCSRLSRIVTFWNATEANSPYIADWFRFLSLPEERLYIGASCESFSELSCSGVTFFYTPDTPCLQDITFRIKKGEKVCIVGINGAGKTSFIKVLLGLYRPTSGEICYNGKPLSNYSLDSYRSQFAVVFQDYQIYAASVRENIYMDADGEESTPKLWEALEKVGLREKINCFVDGLKTNLTKEFDPRGEVLSGGESQKLAIARLFAREFEIAVLDEPSSSLDPIAERDMYDSLLVATEGKTVIYISHNLSSAILADRIVFFRDGRIAEEGTHQELLALNGQYAKMFRLQAEKYREED